MHIRAARRFSKYAMVPAGALWDERLSRGHVVTLGRIACYLQGEQKPLEGLTVDFCEVLGIEERTWQNHVPDLGSTGWLLFSRPQRGGWILQAVLYEQPDAESPGGEAKKFSVAIDTLSSSHELGSKKDKEEATTDSSLNMRKLAKRFSLSLPENIFAGLERIGWVGPADEVAQVYEREPERVEAWLRWFADPRHQEGVKPAALFRVALRGETWPAVEQVTAVVREPPSRTAADALWEQVVKRARFALGVDPAQVDRLLARATVHSNGRGPDVLVVKLPAGGREWLERGGGVRGPIQERLGAVVDEVAGRRMQIIFE